MLVYFRITTLSKSLNSRALDVLAVDDPIPSQPLDRLPLEKCLVDHSASPSRFVKSDNRMTVLPGSPVFNEADY
jgi:hypothetical protein